MKRKFTKMTAALALLVGLMIPLGMWGQGDYSTTYTSNCTLTAGTNGSTCEVIVNGNTYDGIKVGTSKNGGDMTVIVPSGAKYLHIHVAAWNGVSGLSLNITPNTNLTPTSVALTSNSGIANNTPFTFSGDPSITDYYKVITFNSALASETTFTFTTSTSKRFVIWGVTYEEESTPATVATPTFSLASGETGTTLIDEDIVMLDCETEGATIYYTMGNNPADPDDQSAEYDPDNGIAISATTTIKAIAYVGSDHSSVASKTYTFLTMKTIAEARAQETGAVYTQGTVTSISGSSAFIQDATAAINVFGDNSLVVGKKYNVVGTLTTYNGLLEITNPTCTEVAGGTVIEPEVMTIANILTSTNQGWFIKIEGATVGSTSSGNTTLTQGESSIVARNLSGASQGDVINLTGNISCYGNTKQIANPLVVVSPSITVDESALTFTYQVGATQAPQETLIVEGSNLEGPVTVSLSGSNFKISEDGSTWGTENIVLTPTNGTLDETMIGVMLNTGLAHGTYEGTITLTSTNAETVTVTLTGTVTNQTYAINLTQPTTGGTIAADKETAEAGQTVTLTATPATGYAFGEWTVLKDDLETEVEVNNNQFVMPNCEVLVSGTFSQANYTITVAETTNGTVECEDQTAHYGDEILVTVTPAEGYRVASFTVTENGGEGSVADIENADNIYSFSMPAYNVTITVVFGEIPDVYGGEGIFNKVTSLDDLEDGGYYVLYGVNGNYKGAMNSTCTSGKMGLTSVTVTNDVIIDPAVTIVWKLEAITIDNENYWMLYNEEEGKYCYISSDGTSAFAMSENPTEGYYSVSVYEGDFSFVGQYGGRMISIYQSDFRCYASSNAKTLYLYKLSEASQDPYITVSPDAVTVPSAGGTGTLAINYDNVTISGTNAFAFQYYDEENQPIQQAPAWMNNVTVGTTTNGYAVNYTIAQNDDADREARFKVYVTVNNEAVESNLVTFTQNKYVAPVTYTLATSIESGRHYIVTNGEDKAMGAQNGNNNRPAIGISILDGVATVSTADVREVVINGPDANGYYTIYDAEEPGYLYAVGGNSNNHLKTETFCQDHGRWTIEFDENTQAASVVANISGRNTMRYNSGSGIFSCYASGQADIYLYVKNGETEYTFVKDIKGYGNATNRSNWYLISSPVGSIVPSNNVENMIESNGNYDLYSYNQSEEKEWINYKQHTNDFELANGQGYLYANSNDVTLIFTGDESQQTNQYWPDVQYDANADNPGWNLIGNPYGHKATLNKGFYVMKDDGTEIIAATGTIVGPMEGVFVQISDETEEVKFTPDGVDYQEEDKFVLNLVQNRSNIVDRAIVRMGEGRQLSKFQLFENSTKIYIPQNGKDYAVVRSEGQGELPVNFRAAENGTYTLSIDTEDMEMNYLHLIDNMTGMDVDLLQTPSYTFEANVTDYESRFKLVFAGASTGSATDETFAFFSNGNLIVNNEGNATLQVIDLNGRILSSETLNGSASINVNQPTGVYMLRLINGDNVKVQKVVVR